MNLKNILGYWSIYSIAKSTAVVTPILPIFFSAQLGLTVDYMLQMASYFVLLPVIAELPASLLGDKFGRRKIILFGTAIFLLGFLALALSLPYAYPSYLLAIAIAAACYSGCEPTYLRSILPSAVDFATFVASVSERVYLISALLLVIGGWLYTVAPKLPVVFQVVMLSIGLSTLFLLPSDGWTQKCKSPASTCVVDKAPDFISGLKLAFALVTLYSGVFSGFVQLSSRTVQLQLAEHLSDFPYLKLGVAFAIGNVFSALGSRAIRVLRAYASEPSTISISACAASLSAWLLSREHLANLICGFGLLCFFKGLYRPVVSHAMQQLAYRQKNQATVITLINVGAALIAAGIHYVCAALYLSLDILYGHLSLMLAVVALLPLFSACPLPLSFTRARGGCAGKNSYVVSIFGRKLCIVQRYTVESTHDVAINVKHARSSALPTPAQLRISSFIVGKWIPGKTLADCDPDIQSTVVQDIVARISLGLSAPLRTAVCPEISAIIGTERSFLKEQPILIHADLHPENIVVCGVDYKVLDWDGSGAGDPRFDLLTLITSPMLSIPDDERLAILSSAIGVGADEARRIAAEFLGWKCGQMSELSALDSQWSPLAAAYRTSRLRWLSQWHT